VPVWAIGVLLHANAVQAYRPFDGTDAGVADYRTVELELGPVGYLRESGRTYLVAPALIANYGFFEDFELVVEGKYVTRVHAASDEPRARLSDSALSIKEVLRSGGLQGQSGLSIANEWSVLLADASSEQHTGAELTTIFSQRWPAVTVHLNLMNEFSRAHRYVGRLDPIIEGPSDWRVRPVTELTLAREFRAAQLQQGLVESALVGFIGRVNETTSFDGAVRAVWASGGIEQEIRLGFTCRL
jgi:hypothetical protein